MNSPELPAPTPEKPLRFGLMSARQFRVHMLLGTPGLCIQVNHKSEGREYYLHGRRVNLDSRGGW